MESTAAWTQDGGRARLSELERIIQAGRRTFAEAARSRRVFIEVALAFREIRDLRWYKIFGIDGKECKTFDAYCRGKWRLSRRHVDRKIAYAETLLTLRHAGLNVNITERQARRIMARPRGGGRGGLAPRRPKYRSFVSRLLRLAEEDCRSAGARIRQTRIADLAHLPDTLDAITSDISRAADVEERRSLTVEEMIRDSAMEQADVSGRLAERRLAERADLDVRDVSGRRRKESLAREHREVAAAAEEAADEASGPFQVDLRPTYAVATYERQRLWRLREWARTQLLRIIEAPQGGFNVVRQPDNGLLLPGAGLDAVEEFLRPKEKGVT